MAPLVRPTGYSMSKEITFAIHPSLGIARIGNSDESFFAPEVPHAEVPIDTQFKDKNGAIKRQAARFRVYRYEDGKPVEEITHHGDTKIEWRVHVANRKAAWYKVEGPFDVDAQFVKNVDRRNGSFAGDDRTKRLVIDPGQQTISSANQHVDLNGKFVNQPVYLGGLGTDDHGRLIVRGGKGVSKPLIDGMIPTDFSNNDGWYDDVSDGPVWASVTYKGQTYEAEAAYVVVAPPNYAQGVHPVISMYDLAADMFLPDIENVVFYRDVYPIFERLVRCQWVNEGIYVMLGKDSPTDFTEPALLKQLENPNAKNAEIRKKIFEWFRDPAKTPQNAAQLPPFYGDVFESLQSYTHLSLTRRQYNTLKEWAAGNFTTGSKSSPPPPFEKIPLAEQPDALDRAALDDCLGGPFHPGVELPWILRNKCLWEKPFRLKIATKDAPMADDYGPQLTGAICKLATGPLQGVGPGALTRWMGLPWQTDAASCLSGYARSFYLPLPSYWAVRIPNSVMSHVAYKRLSAPNTNQTQKLKHLHRRQSWMRDIESSDYNRRLNNMVNRWNELGIVAPLKGVQGIYEETMYIETQRKRDSDPDASLDNLHIAEL